MKSRLKQLTLGRSYLKFNFFDNFRFRSLLVMKVTEPSLIILSVVEEVTRQVPAFCFNCAHIVQITEQNQFKYRTRMQCCLDRNKTSATGSMSESLRPGSFPFYPDFYVQPSNVTTSECGDFIVLFEGRNLSLTRTFSFPELRHQKIKPSFLTHPSRVCSELL